MNLSKHEKRYQPYNRKKGKKKKRLWLIPFIFILFLLISVMGIFLLYDYQQCEAQKKQFHGIANAASKIISEADSEDHANDYLLTLIEQTNKNSRLENISGKISCENTGQWNNGDKVTIQLTASCSSHNPFMKKELKESREIAISCTCDHLTMIPAFVKQTGIKGDYTNYVYFYSQWHNDCKQRPIADAWNKSGRPSSDGIATLNGYYLVAVRPLLGDCGDRIRVILEDGTSFDCIIADEKGDDAENYWGHLKKGDVSLIEFEVMGNEDDCYAPDFAPPAKWNGKKVSAVINYKQNIEKDNE